MKPDAIPTMNALLSQNFGMPVAFAKERVDDSGRFGALFAAGSTAPRALPVAPAVASPETPVQNDGEAAAPPVIGATILADDAAPFAIAGAVVAARSDPMAPPSALAATLPGDTGHDLASVDPADGDSPAKPPPQSRTAEPQPHRRPAWQTRAVPGKTLPPAIAVPIPEKPELVAQTHDGDMATDVDGPVEKDVVAMGSTYGEAGHSPSIPAFENTTRPSDVDLTALPVSKAVTARAEPAKYADTPDIGTATAPVSATIDSTLSQTPLRREAAVLAPKNGEHGGPPADSASSAAAPTSSASITATSSNPQDVAPTTGARALSPTDRPSALAPELPAVKDARPSARTEAPGTRPVVPAPTTRLPTLDDVARMAVPHSQAGSDIAPERTDSLLRTRPNTAFSDGIALPSLADTLDAQTAPAATIPAHTPVDTTRQTWLTSMIDRIETMAAPDTGGRDTRITLSPDALGEVSMRLIETDRGIEVALDAASPEARALLAEAAPRLAEMAEARGLRLSPHTGGEAGDGRHRAPPQPQSDAPVPNRRASTMADDHAADERIA